MAVLKYLASDGQYYPVSYGGTLPVAMNDLTDADTVSSPPVVGSSLTWNGAQWVPGGGGSPSGSVTQFAGAAAPSGWLLCDGTALSRTTYADLFAVCGVIYGAGDGSTTFNIPNMRGRVAVHPDSASGEFAAPGVIGGLTQTVMSIAEMPAHVHPAAGSAWFNNSGLTQTRQVDADIADLDVYLNSAAEVATAGVTNSGVAGGGAPQWNLQPYMTINYIIKI